MVNPVPIAADDNRSPDPGALPPWELRMSPITIDHHPSAHAECQLCPEHWETSERVLVSMVLSRGAEHTMLTGHPVAEHVSDDMVVHPS